MKVQITANVETYVTMEVEVADTKEETLEEAMNDVLSNCSYEYEHESIVETEMIGQEMSSHTELEKPLVDLTKCKIGDILVSCHGMELTYFKRDESIVGKEYPHIVVFPNGAKGTRTDDGRVAINHRCPDDHDIVKVVRIEKNSLYDVEIIEVAEVEGEFADAFTTNWAIIFGDGHVLQCFSEDEACEAQRLHRESCGLDPETGE